MPKKNTINLMIISAILVFAIIVLLNPLFGRKEMRLGLDLQGGIDILYQADLSSVKPGEETNVMEGVMAVISNRINPLGVTEPVIQRQGEDRIRVELPGRSITDTEKDRLARVALLEFGELVSGNETAKWENDLGKWKPATGVINGQVTELTSRYFKENTYVDRDNFGALLLVFEWDKDGSLLSEQITSRMIDKPLGIFEGNESLLGEDGRPIAPIVRNVIKDRGQIEGLSYQEATTLSAQLNAGRLPVPLKILSDKTVSPILGADFVDMSIKAGIIGVLLVMLFMIIYYRLSGALASLALIFYAILVLAIFKLIPVTLTLAGLGGFILSVGMAVDANVLIFERMKEELRTGRTLGAAIEAGFDRAWTAIRDSNMTTFIVCGVLYWLGSSSVVASDPVKGFAVTLFIGVAVSMFTAITVSRALLRLFVGTALAKKTSLFTVYLRKE